MNPELLPVEQVDREAAAAMMAAWDGSRAKAAAFLASGGMDDHEFVQAFARHRHAFRPAIDPEALERLRVLSREATDGEWGTGGTFMPNSECPRTSIWGPTPAGMQSGAWIAKDIIPADADLAIAAVAFVRGLLGEAPSNLKRENKS